MEILDGKLVSTELKNKIRDAIQKNYLQNNKTPPTLACILVGNNPASQIYVNNKRKACEYVGINSKIINLPESISFEELFDTITKLNNDKRVSGILLQLPLPLGLDEKTLVEHIAPEKDVDGLTTKNLGALFAGNQNIAPCTATGILDLLGYYKIELDGKHAVVVGRSTLVGKSVAELLEQQNATVTLCHSHTKDLKEITKQADVLIVAVGKKHLITQDMVKDGAVVVDAGINRVEGKIFGDVDFENVSKKCSYITPVPGGVGPMTVAELMQNTYVLDRLQKQKTNQNTIEQSSKKFSL